MDLDLIFFSSSLLPVPVSSLPECLLYLRHLNVCLYLLCISPSCPLFSIQSLLSCNIFSKCPSTSNPYLLLPASEHEFTLKLTPSSFILLINAGKLLPTVISKVILRLIHFKSIQSIQFVFICICMCIPDEPSINVTANKNRPSSYRFTQANQRNWIILHWTSLIPLKVTFSSENNLGEYQDVINSQFFIYINH